MNNIFALTLLFSLTVVSLCAQQPYQLVIHNTDPNAKCLDGSSPAVYLHQGGDTSRFVVFFVGGGFCAGLTVEQTLNDCYQRSKTDLGSSKNLSKDVFSPGGYLSTDPSQSKFATWTKIVIMYCDGSIHQGHVDKPISFKDSTLYFRGADNTRSHIKWMINKYQINKAEKVLFTGASAGGFATFIWNNYIREQMDKPENLYSVADSSIFVDIAFPDTAIHLFEISARNMWKLSNTDEKFPIQACNKKYPGSEWKCLFIQNCYEFLASEVMFVNSQYDPLGIEDGMNISCLSDGISGKTLKNCNSTQMKHIENYRSHFLSIVSKLVSKNHSVWTIACSQHSYACYKNFYNVSAQKIPQKTGATVAQAIDRFVFHDERVVLVDEFAWPKNEPCAF